MNLSNILGLFLSVVNSIKQSKSSGDELISGQTLTLTISKEKTQDQTNPDDEDNQDDENKDSE